MGKGRDRAKARGGRIVAAMLRALCVLDLEAVSLTTWRRRNRGRRDLHFLTRDGMVACNPRDPEAAHRAQVEGIRTEKREAVTCRKCRQAIRDRTKT